MDQNAKSQAIEQIKKAQNVLVTVSDNPSVDQLAAAIGFTLLLNKLNKHATAVFSGQVPSTIEFLKPEETLEGNTDSLRDFIISLDKSKADKLRYKVEDDVVRIYVTPYRTSISQKDLTFDQGDFNVDVVIALGVYNQDQLDRAIKEHGRILHDAAIVSVIAGGDGGDIGGINWNDKSASSLCEMLMGISESLKPGIIDEQIATALLTGIVAETDRFSNEKTTPKAMTMSAQLMSAGANQQLISESLDHEPEPQEEPKPDYEEDKGPSLADITEEQPQEEQEEDGVLDLHHERDNLPAPEQELPEPEPQVEDHHIGIDEEGKFANADDLRDAVQEVQSKGSFKGRTIAPPEDAFVPPSTDLPDLEGTPSYTPGGRVTNAPTSALDEGGQERQDNWHLPQVDWDKGEDQAADQYQNQPQEQPYAPASNQDMPEYPGGDNQAPQGPPVIPMSQGQPYINPDDIPKEHGEDALSEEEAREVIEKQEEEQQEIPEIKHDRTNKEYLDHAPSTDPGQEDSYEAVEEKPSIEQGQPTFSKYITEPPENKDEQKLNSLDGVPPEESVNPLIDSSSQGPIVHPQDLKSTEDPLLSTQHDAESAPTPPTTRHPRLYDDGVGVANKPLGAPVDDDDTLETIEHNVEEVAGSVHGHKETDARQAVMDALGDNQGSNPLEYLDLDSDPAKQDQQANQNGDNSPPPMPPPLMPPM